MRPLIRNSYERVESRTVSSFSPESSPMSTETFCSASPRRFFKAARNMIFPIIYKSYPGLAHEGSDRVNELGFTCFEYALEEYDRATRLNGGKPTRPDWPDLFTSSLHLADIFNQAVYSKFDYLCVPPEFRMIIPSASVKAAWIDE